MKTKPVRVAAEGNTVDNRKIDGKAIQQMAKNFNPAKYGADIWLEHLRGILPESPFASFGSVVSLEARQFDAEGTTRWGLYAVIEASQRLLDLFKTGAAKYWSIELDPNFAGTGEAYMVGLAPTAGPASLWTEPAKFSTSQALEATRHAYAGTLFSTALEQIGNLELEAEAAPNVGVELLAKVKSLFGVGQAQQSDLARAVEEFARLTAEKFKEVASKAEFTAMQIKLDDLEKAAKADREAFAALVEKLSNQEHPGQRQRPSSPGSGPAGTLTDC